MNIRKDMVIGCCLLTKKILINIEYINRSYNRDYYTSVNVCDVNCLTLCDR